MCKQFSKTNFHTFDVQHLSLRTNEILEMMTVSSRTIGGRQSANIHRRKLDDEYAKQLSCKANSVPGPCSKPWEDPMTIKAFLSRNTRGTCFKMTLLAQQHSPSHQNRCCQTQHRLRRRHHFPNFLPQSHAHVSRTRVDFLDKVEPLCY